MGFQDIRCAPYSALYTSSIGCKIYHLIKASPVDLKCKISKGNCNHLHPENHILLVSEGCFDLERASGTWRT